MRPTSLLLASALLLFAGRALALDDAQSIDLAKLGDAREPVHAEAHGHELDCEGVLLTTLLQAQLGLSTEKLRGRALTGTVRVAARDDYAVVFSFGELDPTLGDTRVYVVDRCDGKPLSEEDGPVRLIVPGDKRPARWVRQVRSISVTNP